MKRHTVPLSFLAAVSPFFLCAKDIEFPGAGGDLASLEAWGEAVTSLENWTTNRVLVNKSGTYTATGDISFGGIILSQNNASFVFDMTAGATSALDDTDRIVDLTQQFSIKGKNNETTVKGGTWNFNSKNLRVSVDFNTGCNYQKLRITDGAVMNGIKTFAGGYGSEGCEIVIEGGSRIETTELKPDHDRGTSSLLVISNKAEVTTEKFFGSNGSKINHDDFDYSSKTLVTGEGTRFTVSSSFKNDSSHSKVIVTDGAVCDITGTTYIGNSGNSASSNVYFEVSNDAICNIHSSNVYFSQYGKYDTIAVLNGGVLDLSGKLLLNGNAAAELTSGHHASLIVSNAVFSSPVPPVMGDSSIAAGSNGLVRVMGRNSVFDIDGSDETMILFARSPRNRYEFIDAVWTNNVATITRFNSQSSAGLCTFELRDGAEYYSTNTFYITNLDYKSTNNCLKVLSGSRLYAGKKISTSSVGNSFVVSNATIETLGDFYVTERSYSAHMYGYSNNWLVVQGNMPQVLVTNGTLHVGYQSTIRFDLPSAGYAAGKTPVIAKKFAISSDSDIAIGNIEGRISVLDAPERTVLIETTDGVTVPSAVLERVNASLPEKSYCYVSDDGNDLMLRVYKDTSTFIVLR